MATGNMTVSLDPGVIAMAKAQAESNGLSASAWVAQLIRKAAIAEASRRYDQYDNTATDRPAMDAWDTAQLAEQDGRLAGAEW